MVLFLFYDDNSAHLFSYPSIQTFNPAAKARIIHAPKKPMLGSPTVDFIGDVRARNEPERYKKRNP